MPLQKRNPALAGTGVRDNNLAGKQGHREHTQTAEQNQLIARVQKNAREQFWISVRRFSDGTRKCDIRVWQVDAAGAWLPTPRNIVISASVLPDIIRSLTEAEAQL